MKTFRWNKIYIKQNVHQRELMHTSIKFYPLYFASRLGPIERSRAEFGGVSWRAFVSQILFVRPIVLQVNWAACCRLLARLGVCVIRRAWHVTRVYFNTEMKYGPCALESERGASRARDLPAVLILKQQQQIVSRLSIRVVLSRYRCADEWLIFLCPLCFCSRILMFTAEANTPLA